MHYAISAGHIFFVHELGEATGNIIFKFKLSDPEGNELIDQDFFITVLGKIFSVSHQKLVQPQTLRLRVCGSNPISGAGFMYLIWQFCSLTQLCSN